MTDSIEVLQAVVNDLVLDRPQQETLLDRFALRAMEALVGSTKWWNNGDDGEALPAYVERTATAAWDLAERMVAERQKRLQGKKE